MRVFHILANISFGDGVSNDVRAMNTILIDMGFRSCIYAEYATPSFYDNGLVTRFENMPPVNPDDVIIYHYSIGWHADEAILKLPCRKIMVYHNVTPPNFFKPYNYYSYKETTEGKKHLTLLKDTFDYCLAVSEFNKEELLEFGFTCPIDVLPIIIPFQDYRKKPDASVQRIYADDKTNILFTGRVAPNKKHENIIRAFAVYKKLYDPTARLFLIGSDGQSSYFKSLKRYVKALGVEDVIFSGHISFEEILAYYTIADVFLSMTEHEGFCIPLVEAMFFDVPVIAYANTAIPSTMGNAGILLDTNDPYVAAATIHKVQTNSLLRKQILDSQRKRVEDFSYQNMKALFEKYFTDFLERTV